MAGIFSFSSINTSQLDWKVKNVILATAYVTVVVSEALVQAAHLARYKLSIGGKLANLYKECKEHTFTR